VRSVLTLCAIVCASVLFVGCEKSSSSSTGSGGGKKFTVYFSQCNNAEPYRAAQNDKMTALWKQYPDVEFHITDAQQDDNKQQEQISTRSAPSSAKNLTC
jgi:ribose transport system substrate-binding protein